MSLTNLAIFVILSIFASSTIARTCPLESDCIQNLCKDITYDIGGPDYETPIVLNARCKNDAGNEVLTWIDLRWCIGNFDGFLKWADALSPPFLDPGMTFRPFSRRLYEAALRSP